jgi:hypothetical protein
MRYHLLYQTLLTLKQANFLWVWQFWKRFRTTFDLNPFRTRENMSLENLDRFRILLTHYPFSDTYNTIQESFFSIRHFTIILWLLRSVKNILRNRMTEIGSSALIIEIVLQLLRIIFSRVRVELGEKPFLMIFRNRQTEVNWKLLPHWEHSRVM